MMLGGGPEAFVTLGFGRIGAEVPSPIDEACGLLDLEGTSAMLSPCATLSGAHVSANLARRTALFLAYTKLPSNTQRNKNLQIGLSEAERCPACRGDSLGAGHPGHLVNAALPMLLSK